MLLKSIKQILQLVIPSNIFLEVLILYRKSKEYELELLPLLCNKSMISIDVGASDGLYLGPLRKYSKHCIAFEPRTKAKRELQYMFKKCSNVTIEEKGLSDYNGNAILKIFKEDECRSTLENKNDISIHGTIEQVTISVIKLDDYSFSGKVGFIKIDVEGHEESVLKGAKNLIDRYKPNILVEIEERYNNGAFNKLRRFFSERNYNGYFYRNNKLFNIKEYQVGKLQKLENRGIGYINNFIFIHDIKISNFSCIISNDLFDL